MQIFIFLEGITSDPFLLKQNHSLPSSYYKRTNPKWNSFDSKYVVPVCSICMKNCNVKNSTFAHTEIRIVNVTNFRASNELS